MSVTVYRKFRGKPTSRALDASTRGRKFPRGAALDVCGGNGCCAGEI
jgi:hypothetical protein